MTSNRINGYAGLIRGGTFNDNNILPTKAEHHQHAEPWVVRALVVTHFFKHVQAETTKRSPQ